MSGSDVVSFGAAVVIGGVAGFAIGSVPGAVIGVVVAVALTAGSVRLDIRPLVAVPVLVGTAAGAFIGRMITRILCLPGSCPGFEIAGAILTAIGALVGVGLVVVLTVRSIDEYNEAKLQPPDTSQPDPP